jgi:hypothetical protein
MTTESLLSGARVQAPGFYNAGSVQTVSVEVAEFTGSIRIYASLDADPQTSQGSDWTMVGEYEYTNVTNTQAYTITGNYTWFWADINNDSGNVTAVDLNY